MRTIAIALAASAALAACASYHPQGPSVVARPVATTPAISYPDGVPVGIASDGVFAYTVPGLRPGAGHVVDALRMVDSSGSINRLSVRMDDGSLQVADIRGPYAPVGTRVQITSDSSIQYHLARRDRPHWDAKSDRPHWEARSDRGYWD